MSSPFRRPGPKSRTIDVQANGSQNSSPLASTSSAVNGNGNSERISEKRRQRNSGSTDGPGPSKKPRNDPNMVTIEDEDEENQQNESGSDSDESSQDAFDDNESSAEEEEEDKSQASNEEESAAKVVPSYKDVPIYLQAVPGSLINLHLTNFMCHANFSIDFHPRINFITGRNGSGKSAILSALVLVFGGRASTTSRSSRASTFVMSGKNSASILLTILNYENKEQRKREAYSPSKFDNYIVLERIIDSKASYGSRYRVYTHSHKESISQEYYHRNVREWRLVAEKAAAKKIIEEIVEHFNIEIDNPVVVLTQEVSKTLLNNSKATSKYSFFMRATGLQECQDNYICSKSSIGESLTSLEKKKEEYNHVNNTLNKVKTDIKAHNQIQEAKKRRIKLQREREWRQYWDEFDVLESWRKDLRQIDEVLTDVKAKLAERKAVRTEIDEKIQRLTADVQERNQKANELRPQREEAKREHNKIAAKIKFEEDSIASLESRLHGAIKEKEEITKKMEAHSEKLKKQNSEEAERIKRQQRVTALIDEIELLEAAIKVVEHDCKNQKQTLNKLNADLRVLIDRQIALGGQLNVKKQNLAALERNASQRDALAKFARFGTEHMNTNRIIQRRADEFNATPLGPIAAYCKLLDRSAALAMEEALGSTLMHYIVTDQHDAKILKEIIAHEFHGARQPSVIIRPFSGQRHNVNRFKPRNTSHPTMLDLLEIEDTNVFNTVVDQAQLESILYIAEYSDAETLLIDSNTVPENCSRAFCRTGNAFYPNARGRPYRSTIPSRGTPRHIITCGDESHDNEEAKRQLREDIAAIESQLEGLKSEKPGLEDKVKTANELFVKFTKTAADKKAQRDKLDDERLELSKSVETIPVQMRAFIDSLERVKEKERTTADDIASGREKVKQLKSLQEAKKKTYDEINEQIEAITREVSQEDLQEAKAEKDRMLTELGMLSKRCRDHETERNKKAELIEVKKRRVEDVRRVLLSNNSIEMERTHFHPIGPDAEERTLAQIEADLKVTTEQAEKAPVVTAELPSKEVLVKQLKETIGIRDKLAESIRTGFRLVSTFQQAFELRREGYPLYRNLVTRFTTTSFRQTLTSYGFDGLMVINHKAKKKIDTRIASYNASLYVDKVREDKDKIETDKKVNKDKSLLKAKTLHLCVNPKAGQGASVTNMSSSSKTLSGGERQFTSFAFIVSLWNNNLAPFRILDEMDVFMDMVARRHTFGTMLEFAARRAGQFLFLSPLPYEPPKEYSHIIAVHRLEPPERDT